MEVKTNMAEYTGRQSILDAALGTYKDYGFSLSEKDDHTLTLAFKGKDIAHYNQTKVSIPLLHEGCKNYLASFVRNQED